MDIRTLLTETKAFPPRRKTTASPISRAKSPPTNMKAPCLPQHTSIPIGPKKVVFTLNAEGNTTSSFELSISPSDPPNAITATVKDFFALHNCGVSFTDRNGSILIVTPDNLAEGMEVYVNQTNVADNAETKRKKRKSGLSARKKSRRMSVDSENEDEGDAMEIEYHEKRERILSSEVSVENILDSSRRRLSKFSSEVIPLQY
jgi:hypothetical protein